VDPYAGLAHLCVLLGSRSALILQSSHLLAVPGENSAEISDGQLPEIALATAVLLKSHLGSGEQTVVRTFEALLAQSVRSVRPVQSVGPLNVVSVDVAASGIDEGAAADASVADEKQTSDGNVLVGTLLLAYDVIAPVAEGASLVALDVLLSHPFVLRLAHLAPAVGLAACGLCNESFAALLASVVLVASHLWLTLRPVTFSGQIYR